MSRLKAGLHNLTICKGQWFSRIHVDDIVTILESSMNRVNPGSVYNVCDQHPAQVDEVIKYCSKIMNIELPKMTFYDKHSFPRNKKIFFTGNKKVRSKKILSELKVNLKYPSYKEGLLSLLKRITSIAFDLKSYLSIIESSLFPLIINLSGTILS